MDRYNIDNIFILTKIFLFGLYVLMFYRHGGTHKWQNQIDKNITIQLLTGKKCSINRNKIDT